VALRSTTRNSVFFVLECIFETTITSSEIKFTSASTPAYLRISAIFNRQVGAPATSWLPLNDDAMCAACRIRPPFNRACQICRCDLHQGGGLSIALRRAATNPQASCSKLVQHVLKPTVLYYGERIVPFTVCGSIFRWYSVSRPTKICRCHESCEFRRIAASSTAEGIVTRVGPIQRPAAWSKRGEYRRRPGEQDRDTSEIWLGVSCSYKLLLSTIFGRWTN